MLTPDKLEAYDIAMLQTVEPGVFEILVGTSSADVAKTKLTVD